MRRALVLHLAVSLSLVLAMGCGSEGLAPLEGQAAGQAATALTGSRVLRFIQFNLAGPAIPGIFDVAPFAQEPNGDWTHANYGSLTVLPYLEWEMASFPNVIAGNYPNQPLMAIPDAVLLEEVCYGQYEDLRTRYPNAVFTEMVQSHTMCRTGSSSRSGQVLLSPWPIVNVTRTPLGYTNPGNYPDDPTRWKRFYLTCGDVQVPGIPKAVKTCVAHLRKGETSIDQFKGQVDTIAATLDAAVEAGQPVVFGGDLNNLPGYRTLDELYRLDRVGGWNGLGLFNEGDQLDTRYFNEATTPCTETACRSGQKTTALLQSNGCIKDYYKYDYLFFSRYLSTQGGFQSPSALSRGFVPQALQPAACLNATYSENFQAGPSNSKSDHHLYRAQATLHY